MKIEMAETEKFEFTVTEVTGGYKIVLNGREGFTPKREQVPQRVKDLLSPDFQKS